MLPLLLTRRVRRVVFLAVFFDLPLSNTASQLLEYFCVVPLWRTVTVSFLGQTLLVRLAGCSGTSYFCLVMNAGATVKAC